MYKFTAFVFLVAAALHPANATSEIVPPLVRTAVYEVLAILATAGFVWCMIETIYHSFNWGWRIDVLTIFDLFERVFFPARVERDALKSMKNDARRFTFKLLMTESEWFRLQILDASALSVWGGAIGFAFFWMVFVMVGSQVAIFYNVLFGIMVGATVVLTHAQQQFRARMLAKYGERYETEYETVPLYDHKQRLKGVAVRSRNNSEPVVNIARESA